ncbi:hypothetical protein [Botryobacter ruber]|uniref:hypothetical protein n=1 Tax=Botryobacter ruber TaxID=2171629 RepID=UPI000F64C53E|nr:hypothetical protein [Botryobacter ruber]
MVKKREVSFIIIFFPLLTAKWKIFSLFFACIVIFGFLDARSNVIKYTLSFILGFTYYFRGYLLSRILKVFRILFLFAPFILFSIGAAGVFNIFKMDEYISGNYSTTATNNGEVIEESLTVDTRTFLYEEVISSAFKYDYIILGRSPARGNESPSFGLYALEELKTGKMERFSNEVSILNVFTWTGLLGVILYFLVFSKASYLAIFRSNNTMIKIIGLYISFRWTYAWVEDFSRFDLSYFFLWVMIGMCFSKSFREMNNADMKIWVLGIFNERIRKASYFYDLNIKKV